MAARRAGLNLGCRIRKNSTQRSAIDIMAHLRAKRLGGARRLGMLFEACCVATHPKTFHATIVSYSRDIPLCSDNGQCEL